MKYFNNENKYGIISISFHWITLLILIFQIPLGFYLEDLEFSDFKLSIENYHSIFGMIIFYITLLNKKEVINKSMRFLGVLNSLLGRSSWYRPKLNFD